MINIDVSDLIGKPFDQDGYGPEAYSCYGLAVEVFKRYGINIPRTNISVCACKIASQKEIAEQLMLRWEPAKEIVAPTGIVIKSVNPDFANHLGIFIGDGKMIHTTLNRSVVIDRIHQWKKKIVGYYSYVG